MPNPINQLSLPLKYAIYGAIVTAVGYLLFSAMGQQIAGGLIGAVLAGVIGGYVGGIIRQRNNKDN